MESWRKENIWVYGFTTVLVLGLYWMSHSWHSMWALTLLGMVNQLKSKE